MNYPQSLLDLITDEAVQRAEDHADKNWLRSAYEMVELLASRGKPFTTDDVWDLLIEHAVPGTPEPRAMGAVIRQAQSRKLIIATSEYRLSKRIECHKNPKRVWKPVQDVLA